jgi:hypothetical protein
VSAPEVPVETEAAQILDRQQQTLDAVNKLIEAVNGLGANVQWIIDNVQGIFQMFSNPAFMAQLPQMMGGMTNAGQDGPGAD